MTTTAAKAQGPADLAQVEAELGQFERDIEYLASVHDGLLKEHAGKWAAIFDGRVAAIADTPEELAAKLPLAAVPRSRAVMEFLAADAIAAY